MTSLKKTLNFRLTLAKSRETQLLQEQNLDIKTLSQKYQNEIDSLWSQVQSNPLLAERHAKVQELEYEAKQVNLVEVLNALLEML
jgi:hypothetical protein